MTLLGQTDAVQLRGLELGNGNPAGPVLLLAFRKTEPKLLLKNLQAQFAGLWSPDRILHCTALGRIYSLLQESAKEARGTGSLSKRFEAVLRETENLMIDLKAVRLLERIHDERGWDGLVKLAMHFDGDERVAAVKALGRLGQLGSLETIASRHSDQDVSSAAVLEISRRATFGGYTVLDDPYSESVYKLGRIVADGNCALARQVALMEIANLAGREDSLGESAKMELKRLSLLERMDVMREKAAAERKAAEEADRIAKAPEREDWEQPTGAHERWKADWRLQRLTNEIEAVALEIDRE